MSDKRWKAVERKVAAKLNEVLSDVGNFSPIERIPLLGREGPDLTVNETGLVINVKSRKAIPDFLFPKAKEVLYLDGLVAFQLNDLPEVFYDKPWRFLFNPSFCVRAAHRTWGQLGRWFDHMNKWTKAEKPDGISSIFIHRPRMPIGKVGVVIHFTDTRRLQCNLINSH